MKCRFVLLSLLLTAVFSPVDAAIVYSGVRSVPIPIDPPPVGLEGVYFNIATNATASVFPADWDSAPWINPFFGGTNISNTAMLRPIITGTDRILNLTLGTAIGNTSNFALGEGVSSTHIGPAADQFQLGTPGIIGLTFKTTASGPDHYGWIRMRASNTGPGTMVDWAYESASGTSILAGAIPEPGTALFGVGVALVALTRRSRFRNAVPFTVRRKCP